MKARIKSATKMVARSSFMKVIMFTLIGNVLQTAAFYATKKLNDDGFALLNFGIYVIGLSAILIDAFSKWLLITVSAIRYEDRFGFIRHAIKSTLPPIYLTVITLVSIIYIYSDPTPSEAIIIILSGISILIGIVSIYPQAIIISKEKFILAGLLGLISPIIRIVVTVLWLNDHNIYILFIGFILAAIIGVAFQFYYISRDKNWTGSTETQKTDEMHRKLKFRGILLNGILQIFIAAFYIADGVILKSLMPTQEYSTYVAYAYIYKFPLFITLSMMIVLIGKDFSDGNKSKIFKTLLISLGVIVATYGFAIIFDSLTGSWLLSILGYSRYVVPGLTVIFGLSWLVHTSNYYIFAFLLKIKPHSKTIKISILLYGIMYIAGLFLMHYDTFVMLKGSLAIGVLFLVYNMLYLKFRRGV